MEAVMLQLAVLLFSSMMVIHCRHLGEVSNLLENAIFWEKGGGGYSDMTASGCMARYNTSLFVQNVLEYPKRSRTHVHSTRLVTHILQHAHFPRCCHTHPLQSPSPTLSVLVFVYCLLHFANILGQKKKNQRKQRNKKRAQERRASESENSEGEVEREKVEEADRMDKDYVSLTSSTQVVSEEDDKPLCSPSDSLEEPGIDTPKSRSKGKRKNRKGCSKQKMEAFRKLDFKSDLMFDLDIRNNLHGSTHPPCESARFSTSAQANDAFGRWKRYGLEKTVIHTYQPVEAQGC
ncbi:hypothetical protein PR048_026036 [Dryococelus australis]|uniref:Uncharacterized protein n=1 Tax=Dryococelus australis TaxID=614101 RepID=A0ABQ9GK87_9NEOP|nr:hypothetical protein PR048_026036 [Dryococelus australis]